MTLAAQVIEYEYNGDGTTVNFSVNCRFDNASWLRVVLLNTTTGVETPQAISTNYTVSGVGTPGGGIVTMVVAPPTGTRIKISRNNIPYDQQLSLVPQTTFDPAVLEKELDKLVMQMQQLTDDSGRSLKFPFTDNTNPALPPVVTRANRYLAFDENGVPIASDTPVSGAIETIEIMTANGLAGDVGYSVTQANITLKTTVDGMVKGNGTEFQEAIENTDYSMGLNGYPAGVVVNKSSLTGELDTLPVTPDGILITDNLGVPSIGYNVPAGVDVNAGDVENPVTETITSLEIALIDINNDAIYAIGKGLSNYISTVTYDIGDIIRGDNVHGSLRAIYCCNTNGTTGAFSIANWDTIIWAPDSSIANLFAGQDCGAAAGPGSLNNTYYGNGCAKNVTSSNNTYVGRYAGAGGDISTSHQIIISDGGGIVGLKIPTSGAPIFQNLFLASPDGVSGPCSPRAIVLADLPNGIIATEVKTTANSTNINFYIPFVPLNTTSDQGVLVNGGIYYNPSTGTLTATDYLGSAAGMLVLDPTDSVARALNTALANMWAGSAGGGSVTSLPDHTANGATVTWTTRTTTPTISIKFDPVGILQSDGTTISSASSNGALPLVDSSGAGLTLTVSENTYQKIGNLTYVTATIVYPVNSNTNMASMSGFVIAPTTPSYFTAMIGSSAITGITTGFVARLLTGGDVYIAESNGARNLTNIELSGKTVYISGVYS